MKPSDFKFITDFVKVNYTDSYTTNFDISSITYSGNKNGLTLTKTKLNDKQVLINFKGEYTISQFSKIMSIFPNDYNGQIRIDLIDVNNPKWLNSKYKIVDWAKKFDNIESRLDVLSCYLQMDLNAAGGTTSVFGNQFNIYIFNDNIRAGSQVDVTFKLTFTKPVRTLIKDNQKINNYTFQDKKYLIMLLNDLQKVTTSKTLTIGSTNLALLTDEDKKIATDKGWTLA